MKNLIITGAAGAFGREIIKAYKKRYNLICIDLDKKKLKKLKKEFSSLSIYVCDLININQVKRLIKKIIYKHGNFDIVINNAGLIASIPIIKLSSNGKFTSHNFSDWKKILNANLNSNFLFSSKVIEALCNKREKGLIINISSISGEGNVGQSAYSVAKSSIEILTKIWAQELSLFDIRVACIAPGFFDTVSTHKSLSKSKILYIKKNTPAGRLGKTSELVQAINFIIKNKFFSGKVLKIDGGLKI